MPGLLIKDVPPELHARLKARAATNRRSLTAEALRILETALGDRAGPPTLAELDTLRIRGRAELTQELLDHARTDGRQ